MNQELFIQALNTIQEQFERDKANDQKLREVFPEATPGTLRYNTDNLVNMLIRILEAEMEDTIRDLDDNGFGHTWITYFIYELDFGRKNDRLKVYNAYREEMPMSTAEDLYHFLMQEEHIWKGER